MDSTASPRTTRLLVGLVAAAALALAAVVAVRFSQRDAEGAVRPEDLQAAQAACMAGEVREGVARLDSLVALAPGHADALYVRGQCRSARFAADSVQADARAAFADLTAAIEAVQAAPEAFQISLDRLYHQRAFVVQAVRPGDWPAALADLDRSVDLNPDAARVVLDRGVARALAGDTAAARADLRRYERLAPAGSAEARGLRDRLRPPSRDTVRQDTVSAARRS